MIGVHSVGVVVPCRDAAETIGSVVRSLPSFVDRAVIVDDGSRDGTGAWARRAAGASGTRLGSRVQVLSHAESRGLGAALVTGYRALLALGIDIVLCVGPGEPLDLGEVEQLLEPLLADRADFVTGSRLRHEGGRLRRLRHWRGHLVSALGRWATGAGHLSDAACSHHAIRREALKCLPLSELWRGEGFILDVAARAHAAGIAHEDVAIRPTTGRRRHAPPKMLLLVGWTALRRLRAAPRTRILPPHARALARERYAREVNAVVERPALP